MKKISALFLSAAMLAAGNVGAEPAPLMPQPFDVVITKDRVATGKHVYATTYEQGEPGHLLVRLESTTGLREVQLPCNSGVVDIARAKVGSYNRADQAVLAKLVQQAKIGNHNGLIDKFQFSDVDGTFDHDEGLIRASRVISTLIARDMERSIAAHNAFCPQP